MLTMRASPGSGCARPARRGGQEGLARPGVCSRVVHSGVGFLPAALLALVLGTAAAPAGAADPTKGPRAEVQISVCSPQQDVVRALGLRADASAPDAVWFFDTPDRLLRARGLRVRLRRAPDGGDLTVKLSGQDCARMLAAQAVPPSAKCEIDVRAGSRDGTLSLVRALTAAEVAALISDTPASGPGLAAALEAALDERQRATLRVANGQTWPAPDSMRRIGPASASGYRAPGRKYSVEFWQLPDGTVTGEASQRVAEPRTEAALAELQRELERAGIAICEEQLSQSARLLRSRP